MRGRLGPRLAAGTAVAGLSIAMWATTATASTPRPTATGWRILTMPQPPGSGAHQPVSISCPTRAFCMAVGTTTRNQGQGGSVHRQSPMAETFDGAHWTLRYPATPSGATLTELLGVSCPTATDCTVVGATGRGNIATGTLAENWNGKTWRIEATVTPAGAAVVSDLFSVSCPSVSSCMAVGTTEHGQTRPLAETWQSGGVGWKVVATVAPVPRGATSYSDALVSVSCPSAKQCVAVGGESDETSATAAESNLVEGWNGTAWSDTPVPSSAVGSTLFGVSCPSPTSCVAGGQTDVDANDDGLATSLVLAGSHWSLRPAPHLGGERVDDFVGVSCLAPASCTAVGLESGTKTGALAEHWNGSRWSVQTTPDPGADSALADVACARGSRCIAVGSSGLSAYSEVGPTA